MTSAPTKRLRSLLGRGVKSHLGEIRSPALVIAADRDYWPLDVKRDYVAKMPNARIVVIPDARHAIAIEMPDDFNRVLASFSAMQE